MPGNRRIQEPEEWALVVYFDILKNGQKVESESVVPVNWLSNNNTRVWWPEGVNVKNKTNELPKCDGWSFCDVIKLKFTGIKNFSVFSIVAYYYY